MLRKCAPTNESLQLTWVFCNNRRLASKQTTHKIRH